MITLLKASQKIWAQTTPDLLRPCTAITTCFRAMLQVNLTVLATAHAVSEGIVRGVNTEIQRRNIHADIHRRRTGARSRAGST